MKFSVLTQNEMPMTIDRLKSKPVGDGSIHKKSKKEVVFQYDFCLFLQNRKQVCAIMCIWKINSVEKLQI